MRKFFSALCQRENGRQSSDGRWVSTFLRANPSRSVWLYVQRQVNHVEGHGTFPTAIPTAGVYNRLELSPIVHKELQAKGDPVLGNRLHGKWRDMEVTARNWALSSYFDGQNVLADLSHAEH